MALKRVFLQTLKNIFKSLDYSSSTRLCNIVKPEFHLARLMDNDNESHNELYNKLTTNEMFVQRIYNNW